MAIPSQDLKCRKCGTEKPRDEFYVGTGGYIRLTCKACAIKASRTRYRGERHEELKAQSRAASKAKYQRVKDACFAAYGGYICACCGETEKAFLSIDHINNDGAAFRMREFGKRNASGYLTYKWLEKHGFPSGHQVLCMNCQAGKRMNDGVCPHQVRCNDYPQGVGPSGPKRIAPTTGEDIVCSNVKALAA